ncbi:DUF1127 domain-containing protein [Shimia sp. R9_1]|uniref:DUF1127 domain-containing protein n=1 Tax=unclassified Shimia TaxID=2630038 RepID=UPI001ADAF26C|nr:MULTISPECIES: DUF1127 domain-containing protein [unclassified Shimia]MBO9398066.1 DUF1127 domain-containing protein [Shimia sp. R9_2]MBO9401119.1 DUF1127 domain-containing protein [Shimia sp. R9_3]MBO9406881.1 DUF1127 domain-containing protein [Shimia sp. R9_1]
MANANITLTSGSSFTARIQAAVEAFKEARILRQKYHATVRELSGMTDRDLADIGILRHDIAELAEKHVYG